ncbi:MAG: threonine synthase [Halobacteriales archaeon]
METTDAFAGLTCVDCGESFDPEEATHRCPECGGILDPQYDLSSVPVSPGDLADRPFDTMWRYEELLPFPRERAVTMDEGATPLVSAPDLAAELGVGELFVKDEGRNPTGTFKDRGQTLAVTAAVEHGAEDVVLSSAGNAGQAATAYAARADVDAHVFLPSRAGFTQKAMVNVHGGDLEIVGGRITEAGEAFEEAREDHPDWYPVQTFVTPYRHEGKKTMLLEIVEQRDWTAPDAVVYPTGGGVGIVGMHKAAGELRELGWIDDLPAMYAAQSTGCAPIVDAFEAGEAVHEAVEYPDTVCGGIEIPDPGASPLILEALRDSGGGAVATGDDEILDAAVRMARETGLEMGHTCAAAASGAFELAARGEFDEDDTVVLLNTGAANKNADVIRSHLMGRGE